MPAKPVPRIDATDAPFWAACNERRVLIQRCIAEECGRHVYYPRVCCPHCRSDGLAWEEVSGHGRIETYTVVHRPHHPAFEAETPYLFAAVRLDEGVLIYGRLVAATADSRDLIGQAVGPTFIPHDEEQMLLGFRLAIDP